MSLALATLFFEWRRYTAAVVALALAGLLILAEVGMFVGIVRGVGATPDRSPADIIVMGPGVNSLVSAGPSAGVPARVKPLIYMNPSVTQVEALYDDGGMWQNVPGPGEARKTAFVQIWTVNPRPGAANLPLDYSEATRIALLEPGAVAVDRTSLAQLGVKLNGAAILRGRTVHVRAILDNYPSIEQPTVAMSEDTYRMLGLAKNANRTGPLMVRIKDPAMAEAVRDQLNAASHGAYNAVTHAELTRNNEGALMSQQIVGMLVGFSVFLGFLIGVGITSQTLRGAVLGSIREFASLRALGVSMGSLRLLVVELSFWVGVVGLGSTALLTWGVLLLAKSASVPMGLPLNWAAGVAALLLGIAMVSGLMSLGVLKKSQPADLLR